MHTHQWVNTNTHAQIVSVFRICSTSLPHRKRMFTHTFEVEIIVILQGFSEHKTKNCNNRHFPDISERFLDI